MRALLWIVIALWLLGGRPAGAQERGPLSAGPMLAFSEMTETAIWVQTRGEAEVKVRYWPRGKADAAKVSESVRATRAGDHIATVRLRDLPMGTRFDYEVWVDGKKIALSYPTAFQTQPHWRFRTDPPALTFAFGSCAYINDEPFDRPGKPYGSEYEIFGAIAAKEPDFMLWLGDNIYFREPDWLSESAMRNRYRHSRAVAELQPLLARVHHYATWDDHDFGPNDSDRSFRLKDEALRVFSDYWPGMRYGHESTPGTFQRFEWGDVEFFLLDDRYHRAPNRLSDPDKRMLGEAQMRWLMDGLASSRAPFKFVVCGGQMINAANRYEGFDKFPFEQRELLDFIARQRVPGVVFLSGDRHAGELLKITPPGGYPLYEFTSSALTAGAGGDEREKDNPARVPGTWITQRHNFGLIQVTGKRGERALTLLAFDRDGKEIWRHTITEKELRFP